MVSKSTSILMAVAIIAVGIVAIVGLGYAYTASTQNAGNEVDSSYLTVTQASYSNGFEDNSVVFSTSNPEGEITYTLSGTVVNSTGAVVTPITLASTPTDGVYVAGNGGAVIYKLGDSTFIVNKHGMSSVPNYTVNISGEGINTTNFKIFVSLDNTNFYAFTGSGVSIPVNGFSTDSSNVTVNLYVANGATPPTNANQKPLTDATFTIVAEVA